MKYIIIDKHKQFDFSKTKMLDAVVKDWTTETSHIYSDPKMSDYNCKEERYVFIDIGKAPCDIDPLEMKDMLQIVQNDYSWYRISYALDSDPSLAGTCVAVNNKYHHLYKGEILVKSGVFTPIEKDTLVKELQLGRLQSSHVFLSNMRHLIGLYFVFLWLYTILTCVFIQLWLSRLVVQSIILAIAMYYRHTYTKKYDISVARFIQSLFVNVSVSPRARLFSLLFNAAINCGMVLDLFVLSDVKLTKYIFVFLAFVRVWFAMLLIVRFQVFRFSVFVMFYALTYTLRWYFLDGFIIWLYNMFVL